MSEAILEDLRAMLKPAGRGLHVISTGAQAQMQFARRYYQLPELSARGFEADLAAAFEAQLQAIAQARVVMVGIPSDTGAGFIRGANTAPQALRERLVAQWHTFHRHSFDGERFDGSGLRSWFQERGVVDIGDVWVVPQLLEDGMLNEAQIARTRQALYGDAGRALPVSPLSMARAVFERLYALNPNLKIVMLGGDHSCAMPVVQALSAHEKRRWGIVQLDAHTDLLSERLGIEHCFATWSYHANEQLGRDGRLVQLGLRASRYPQSHWEQTLGVKQFWAKECLKAPHATIEAVVRHLKARQVQSLYFSNDIDGTDSAFAEATGTPEANGLTPDFVAALITRLKQEFTLAAGDIVEVAPPLGRDPESRERTLRTAVDYLIHTLLWAADS